MKRAAIYMRVSTSQQVQEGDSIPAQRDALLKYIDQHSDMVLAGEYLDDGVSGTKSDRDELNRLLDNVKAGNVDIILVTKLDRLYRSIRHYLNMMDVLDRYGVGWIAIWEPIYDTTTPQGRLIVNQMMSIAQFEAENTGQRIRQVFGYKKAKGEVVSGNVSPGYQIVDKHLVPDGLAPAVREVFEYFARTGKLYETVRMADKRLPHTKQGIKSLLRRRIYIGEAYGNPNYCEPIISRELFDKVQLQLSRNIKGNQKRTYLFTGLIRCAECGVVMASGSEIKCDKRYNRYRCPKHFQNGKTRCDNPKIILEHKLEEYLIDNLEELIEDARIEAEATAKPVEDAKKKRKSIEAKIDRLTDLYVDGQISKDDYLSRKDVLVNDLSALEIPAEAPTSQILGFDAEKGINLYHKLTTAEKREFWRAIIREIRFDKCRNITVYFL